MSDIRVHCVATLPDENVAAFLDYASTMIATIQERDSGTLGWAAYRDASSGVTVFQEHYASAQALIEHATNARSLGDAVAGLLEVSAFEICGTVTDEVREFFDAFGATYFPTLAALPTPIDAG